MNPTIQKILSRFNGDFLESINYCSLMAAAYPRLAVEYNLYKEIFIPAWEEHDRQKY